MRWSLFFLIATFVALSMYVGWKQGAFEFRYGKMALPEVAMAEKKATVDAKKISARAAKVKEPLKSQLIDLIKNRKWDAAVVLYEKEKGKTDGLQSYQVMQKLAEEIPEEPQG